MTNNTQNVPVLKALVVIIDSNQAKNLAGLLQERKIPFNYQIRARGTASNEVLDVLGIAPTGKTLTISISTNVDIDKLINKINREGILSAKGGGIAFTMPLSGVGSSVLKLLSDDIVNAALNPAESDVRKVSAENKHELIIASINQGYSEELMEKAKAAGARGGTVVHARGIDNAMKFAGISMQAEREIIAILTEKTNKVAIMKTLYDNFGVKSEAHGIIISLPVDAVAGIDSTIA